MIPTTADDQALERYVSNIVTAYRAASPDQLKRGQVWYRVAHDLAEVIGNGDVSRGAGILAALSANKRWAENVRLAEDAVSGDIHGHTEKMLSKVRAIMEGSDPAGLLPMSLKTGNFYRSIMSPDDPDPVVIDRHAHDVAVGERYGSRNRGLSNETRYATLALAYRLAARQLGVIPSVVQSVTWVRQIERTGQ